jgi:uncharacterized protein (TIGR01244 family)
MTTRALAAHALLLLTVAAPALAAQRLAGARSDAAVPAPVLLDTTGLFQARYAKVGDDIFIGGQPTERALRELKAQGVTTVVNLRSPVEMERYVRFDEPALVRELGMTYVHIPMRGTADLPYSPDGLKAFAIAMAQADGKVLLHCTIAWRASHLWAAYLIQYRGVPVETALAHTRTINLMDDHRMDGDRQPLELFLGRTIPELGHPRAP